MPRLSEHNDASRPALVLLHGTTTTKRRVLDQDALVLGRARGCDVNLDAPDVSTLHCIITHGSYGYHVRDCGSRAGTRVNGDKVQESTLHDGDLLQIGPFCFRLNLPGIEVQPNARVFSEQKLKHLERSRRNLGRLAVTTRRQLHRLLQEPKIVQPARMPGETPSGLHKKSQTLQARVRDFDERLRDIESRERDLQKEKLQLDEDAAALDQRVAAVEAELELRRKAVERDIDRLWEEHRARCQQDCQMPGPGEPANQKAEHEQRDLEIARQELQQRHELLARNWQAMQFVFQERTIMQENLATEQAETGDRLANQGAAIAQAEAQLREQRAGILKMMAELRKLQENVRSQQNGEAAALRKENEVLQREMQETQRRFTDELGSLRQENEELLTTITDLERERTDALMNAPEPGPAADPGLEHAVQILRDELERLREDISQKDQLIETLRKQAEEGAVPPGDPQSMEAELYRFRRHLEIDRVKLNAELASMRERNDELDAETRKLEMEMSKERAEMARERAKLERLREEIRMDAERLERQRENGSRDRMGHVQKLRDDINGVKPVPTAKDAESRLSTVRRGLTDTPK